MKEGKKEKEEGKERRKENKKNSPVNKELKLPSEDCMKKARVSRACSVGVTAEGRSIM